MSAIEHGRPPRARVVHLECSSGVAGDMLLGALLDAGASLEAVHADVQALGVGNVRITLGRVQRAGVRATSVRVHAPEETPSLRTWEQVRRVLERAPLDDLIRARAVATFRRLVVARGEASGLPAEAVELHDVATLDTLADIVGTVAALASLAVDRVTCGPIAVGRGEIDTVHGRLRVPDRAVTSLLRGFPTRIGPRGVELTTPTGAALIAELATPVRSAPPLRVEREGVGAGAADLPRPNVVRAHLGSVPAGLLAEPRPLDR
jgi:hypothetical protein